MSSTPTESNQSISTPERIRSTIGSSTVHTGHHQHPTVLVNRPIDQHVVGAHLGQRPRPLLQQRTHPGRVGHPVVERDDQRVLVDIGDVHRNWSFITLPVAFSGSWSRNTIDLGTLKPAIRSLLHAMQVGFEINSAPAPFLSTTKALPT